MFRSATFKLTSWYLAIIVAVCLLFSVVIYTIASNELIARIQDWQTTPYYSNQSRFLIFREQQVHQAEANLILSLAITNVAIWTLGGVGSYYLAKRTLRPIEKAHTAQSRFTSDASHELRTPLASMKTELEVALRDRSLTPSEMRELLASNLEEVNKLTQLSHTLLQLSRLEQASISREKVALQKLAKTTIQRFGEAGKRIALSGGSYTIVANQPSLEELLTILLDNALKYSPEGSKIHLNFVAKKQMAGFEVTNSGKGIPAQALPHIFERFYRVDRSRSSGDTNGYGLGLALAKKIVELNNGDLSVTSGAGAETTFQVYLPK